MSGPDSRMRRVLLPGAVAGDPLDAIAMAPGEPAFYWRSDDRDIEIAALGAVAVIDASGPARFRDAAAQLEALRARIDDIQIDDDALGADAGILPLAVGGFAFDDAEPSAPWQGFPALRFFVPRVLWLRRGDQRRIVVTRPAAREQTPLQLLATGAATRGLHGTRHEAEHDVEDGAAWRARVEAAVEAIRAGRLEKIVLARRHTVSASAAVTPLLRALAEARPGCFTFLVRWSGRTFLGSSPERLLKLQDGCIEADALAGTAPRGLSRPHDETLARELLASSKETREHRIVADAIRCALEPLARGIEMPSEPCVLTLPEAHHLHTPVRARLAGHDDRPSHAAKPGRADGPSPGPNHENRPGDEGLLAIAERLHPTPAVCGSPREQAFRQLAVDEPDRGWYGGAVGWMSARGEGELAVALRAALLDGGRAHVWAGAGIVEGSCPEREYDETERKMRSILPYFERGGDDECAA